MTAPSGHSGLSLAEVEERWRRGETNDIPATPSRTVAQILRANIITRFNILLGSMLAIIVYLEEYRDALFGIVLVANTLIGIVQELRAKWTLDRLALLSSPKAVAIREGKPTELAVNEVVLDDLLKVAPGDQLVVDGEVAEARGLEIDESLLTGESEPVVKTEGDQVLSGSFVAAGEGLYRATKVGAEAYAVALAEEARRFTLVKSELRQGVNQILALVTWAMVPTAILLVWSQMDAHQSWREAARASIAGLVAMVPEGLVLLTSIAFAVGVTRLGKRQVLVQELPAIEGLARVDVVCVDKTGTITTGDISMADARVLEVEGVSEEVKKSPELVSEALGALAATDPNPNASLRAIADTYPDPAWKVETSVPFSSARKWSGASFAGKGTWILGAPEVLIEASDLPEQARSEVAEAVSQTAETGRRVLLLARASGLLAGESLPGKVYPAALVELEEQIRPDAPSTLAYLDSQGVELKVISGDNPKTVASVAAYAGVRGAGRAVDARDLPGGMEGGITTESSVSDELAAAVDEATVFGRVTPHQKRAMVAALQKKGHVVAMTGDGVNDVLALKDSDIGIAMGSGSSAARAVAQLVLLNSSFATIPPIIAEGRRVIANIERVASLFLTKTVYALLLALAVGVAGLPFPFLPRHLTLAGSVTIGIPAFFLALAPNARRAKSGFVKRVMRFAAPAGFLAATATFVAYLAASGTEGVNLDEARTAAVIGLTGMGLWVLTIVARPLNLARRVLIALLMGGFFAVIAFPFSRDYFALDVPPPIVLLATAGIVAAGGLFLEIAVRISARSMRPQATPFLNDHSELDRPAAESRRSRIDQEAVSN